MKTERTLIGRLYARLWRPFVGRPWTYAIRQAAAEHPVRTLALATLAGLMAWKLGAALPGPLGRVLDIGAGVLIGHLFCDTRGAYIRHRNFYVFRAAALSDMPAPAQLAVAKGDVVQLTDLPPGFIEGTRAGMADLEAGKTRPWPQIREGLGLD